MSRFGNANKLAKTYRKGRVLLAGDAAHIHLPAGGQGLNYGIQDAFNLGWRLSLVINQSAPEKVLDDYHMERHAIGRELMESVRCQEVLMNNFSLSGLTMRKFFENKLMEIEEVNELLTLQISGLSIEYPSGNINAHPLTGKRIPDLKLLENNKEVFLYDKMYEGRFTLILLSNEGTILPEISLPEVNIMKAKLIENRTEYNNLRTILIRPDTHIALASNEIDMYEIKNVIDKYLKKLV